MATAGSEPLGGFFAGGKSSSRYICSYSEQCDRNKDAKMDKRVMAVII
jgi:hypothetical protein